MPKLLFLSRVAFICNLCFIISFLTHYLSVLSNGIIPSTIIILGNVLALIINSILILLFGFILLSGKSIGKFVPPWLGIVNILFFIFQFILLLR